jgi:DNA-directed RNA polymerase
VNKEFLEFVLQNKEQIYEILLKNYEKDSIAYKSAKEQNDIILNIAQYMSKYNKFYFTYELDYRGRLYAEQEYFNYQGNMLARSLIR